MITQEHLEHWIEQTRVRLDAMDSEIAKDKVGEDNVLTSTGKNVSFEYLREKITMIRGFMRCIEDDILHDKAEVT